MEEKTKIVTILLAVAVIIQLAAFCFGKGELTFGLISTIVAAVLGYYFGKAAVSKE